MRFYLATSFLFPRSLRLRLFTLCLIATHLPLSFHLVWGVASGRMEMGEFVALMMATGIGMGVALIGIGTVLDPIHALAETFRRAGAEPAPLAEMGDVIHTLYAGVHHAAHATRAHLDGLHLAAHEDMLTGIPNRRGFHTQMEQLPPDERQGCIAIVDIDHFKQVNDLSGHDEGDRVLRAFADRLLRHIRRADVVARWGGEEFILFFHGSIEDEASWSLARIARHMRQEPVGRIDGRPISFSAGLSRWQGGDLDQALQQADRALYEAKRSGRDRICRAVPAAIG